MPIVAPFKGLRYNPKKVRSLGPVVAPPYDVISPAGQTFFYRKHPWNFVRVVFGKTYPSDNKKRNRYSRAKAVLNSWIQQEILTFDPDPSVYPHLQEYTLSGKRYRRWGVIALVHLDSPQIYPHENVKREPMLDRLELLKTLQGPLSPIFGLIPDENQTYQRFIRQGCRGKKPVSQAALDGVRHTLWRISDPNWIQRLQTLLKPKELVIADGHHRLEAALRYRQLQKRSPRLKGAAHDYAMFYLAASGRQEPGLLPTHRVIEPISQRKRQELLDQFEAQGALKEVAPLRWLPRKLQQLKNQGSLAMGLYTGNGASFLMTPTTSRHPELDVEWLHQEILPNWIGDPIEISYDPDFESAVGQVRHRAQRLLFVMQPPTLADVLKRARQSIRMPGKTTYFYPKPLSGLVEYLYEKS